MNNNKNIGLFYFWLYKSKTRLVKDYLEKVLLENKAEQFSNSLYFIDLETNREFFEQLKDKESLKKLILNRMRETLSNHLKRKEKKMRQLKVVSRKKREEVERQINKLNKWINQLEKAIDYLEKEDMNSYKLFLLENI